MKFEKTSVYNIKNALYGMRAPLQSWDKSDSYYDEDGVFIIGEKDAGLAKRLINSGTEHRKFLRQILVSVYITAPLYWWKEMDQYKTGGITTNSTSTMHTLASKEITLDNFEIGDLDVDFDESIHETLLPMLESLRVKYKETKDKRYWKELVRWLPESWLQSRMVTLNYENIRSIVKQREGHRLTEWQSFINWALTLPYASTLIITEDE